MSDRPRIVTDAFALAGVLLQALEEDGPRFAPLRSRLAHSALELVEVLTLASASSDPWLHLDAADRELAILRTHLRLALELSLIDPPLYRDFLAQTDLVGRQLGGWLRSLEGAVAR